MSTPVPTFAYDLAPSSLLVSQTQQLVLTVRNPGPQPIDCPLALMITVVLPVGTGAADLVAPAGAANVAAAVQDPSWTQNVDATADQVVIQIVPLRATQLAAGAELHTVIAPLLVNDIASDLGAEVRVHASIGGDQGPVDGLEVAKIAAGLTIAAFAVPDEVGLSQSTAVSWSATGGARVRLTGNGIDRVQSFTGPGPVWSGRFDGVLPAQFVPQTTFRVTVEESSGNDTRSTDVLVDLRPPHLDPPTASSTTGLAIDQTVTLDWTSRFGVSASLDPVGPVPLQGRAYPVVPGRYLYGNDDSVELTLGVSGYRTPAAASLTFTFAPAEILYFSLADPNDPTTLAAPVVSNGKASWSLDSSGVWTLTVVGPGGPLVRTIGSNAPEVRYFGPPTPTLPAPGSLTLSYVVHGYTAGDSLKLDPGGDPLQVDADGAGTTTVQVAADMELTLVAVLSGVTIRNTVSVRVGTAECA